MVHTDIRAQNIVYNPKTKKFALIDFDSLFVGAPIYLSFTSGTIGSCGIPFELISKTIDKYNEISDIKVNKEKEPTILGKISNKFKEIFGGVTTWYNNNQEKVILGALSVCIIALLGLSIYIVVDYNKYKDVIAKVRKVTEINEVSKERNIVEEISKNTETTLEVNEEDTKNNKGKHF